MHYRRESAFADVLELMKQLLKDLEFRPVDILMALLVLNSKFHNYIFTYCITFKPTEWMILFVSIDTSSDFSPSLPLVFFQHTTKL